MSHEEISLHRAVGKALREDFDDPPRCDVLLSPECGGQHRLPFFCTIEKSRATHMYDADLAIACENVIRVRIKVEESNFLPLTPGGKFLTTYLAPFYIHGSKRNRPIKLQNTTFIQIMSDRWLHDGTQKIAQWNNLERLLRSTLPTDGPVRGYYLLNGRAEDFLSGAKLQRLLSLIQEALNN
jgi:hypothetical protein